jgi:hypothetical protein
MPPTQTPVAAAPTTEVPEPQVEKPDAKPDEENSELAKVRREAANYRTKLREREQAEATLKAASEQQQAETNSLKEMLAKLAAVLNPDANTPPDPAKLLEQLTAKDELLAQKDADYQREIRNLTVRATLPSVLAKASADPQLTEAVLTASGALSKLDPSADTFTADLESAVAAAMEANPRLKIDAPVAQSRKSGAEIPGRSGGSDQLTIEQIRAMSPDEINKARKAGRMTGLGIGRG